MRYRLDNGLTVVFTPQPQAPVVAIQVWVKAGSADERPGEHGLAHLHEHMLFKGTRRRGLGEVARDVEARGGEINAWTSFDQTVYHVVLASRFFAEGLDVLADAVREPLFDPGELSREIEVVVEEIKRSEDMPSRKLSKALFAQAYPTHPYGRPVIGTEASVRAMDQTRMLGFFGRHYRPDNIVLAIAGDLDEETLRREVTRRFGGAWGAPAEALPKRRVEAAQRGCQAHVVHDDAKEAHLALAFPIPDINSPDLPALDALALILGQGESSRLELEVRRQLLVNESHAYAYTPKDPGLFVLEATLEAAKLPGAVPAMLAEALRLCEEPVDASELAAAKTMLEAEAVYQRETVQGTARRLGFFEAVAGGLEEEERYQRRVAGLTPADLRQVARRFIAPARCTAVALVPRGTALGEEALRGWVETSQAPPARTRTTRPSLPYAPRAAPSPAAAGDSPVLRHSLKNGVTLLIKPERGVPLVSLRAVMRGGLLAETEADNGIHELLARSLVRGTKTRSAEAVAQLCDAMAGSVSGNAGRNSMGLRGELLSRHLDAGLDLFAECLLEPALDEEEVARERALQLQHIRTRDDHPSAMAFRLFSQALYPGHPYRLDVHGEEASLPALTGARLRAAHQAQMQGPNLVLCVVGDVDPDHLLARVEPSFAALPARERPLPAHAPPSPPSSIRRAHQEADKAQAHLVYGFLGATVRDPDRYALEVLSSVLAGQGGRLFTELRDKRSLAYSVGAFSLEGVEPGYFAVYMATSPEKVDGALDGIQLELTRVLEEPVSAQELERARQYLIGAHAIALQKNAARAALIAFDEAYGLGAEHFRAYAARIEAVGAEEVLAAARRVILPDRACLALLGPKR